MSTDLFSLDGKTAVVVGGGGILAGEMAMGLARAGADVVILDLNEANAQARAAAIRELGRRAIGIRTDATRNASVGTAASAVSAGRTGGWAAAGGLAATGAAATRVSRAIHLHDMRGAPVAGGDGWRRIRS